MWATQTSVEVAAPPQRIYDYLSDLRRHKEWSTGVADIEQIKGEGIQEGAEFKAQERVPAKFTSFSRITGLEPPSRIEWRSWDGRLFNVDWMFEIKPNGGLTQVVQSAHFQPQNLFGQLLLTFMRKRQIPKENGHSLRRLKQRLEA